MPLDITLFRRDGGNPDLIRESQRRRFADVQLVDDIIAKDDQWRLLTGQGDNLRKARNAVQKEIGNLKKTQASKKDLSPEEQQAINAQVDALLAEKNRLDAEIEANEALQKSTKVEIDAMINKVGNIVLDSVPVSNDEDADNRVERTWGTPRDPAGLLNHHDLLWRIGGYEPERGAAVAGHRGYFLRDVGVLLNQAFINYGISFLRARGYSVLQPPFMMKRDVMSGVAQLSQFDEELYKVTGETEDKYLIATSEQPICAFHMNEWMEEKQLPLYYAGISTCFRKEAGNSGKDTWGIFRVHQFEKVEQFAIVEGDLEKSNAVQESMIALAEEFYQSLGFPYRVINIVSGALNNAAIRKFDLEAWFPGYNNYRELVSCSNCTDYQSRAMEIRCGQKKLGEREKKYVHMLNATLCATGRAICCLLETYQEKDGVRVPEVLVPFMGGLTFLPFVREARKTTEEKGGKAAAAPAAAAKPAAQAAATTATPPTAPPTATTSAATTAAASEDTKKKEKDAKKADKDAKKAEKKAAEKAAEQPRVAVIPDSVRPPPPFLSPAPHASSQILGLSTPAEVPRVLEVVSTTVEGEGVQGVHVQQLEERLRVYSYVGGDVPNVWDQRVFEYLTANAVSLEGLKAVQRWVRHLQATDVTVRQSWR